MVKFEKIYDNQSGELPSEEQANIEALAERLKVHGLMIPFVRRTELRVITFDGDPETPPEMTAVLMLTWTPTDTAAPIDAAVAIDPRDGEGWPDAVARQGIAPPPYGSEYFDSTHWQLTRDQYRTGRCSNCKRDGRTDLHHRTYVRLGCERPEDVEELCRVCHNERHAYRKAA